MKSSMLIKVNICALAIWYILMPFASKTVIYNYGGTSYDVSRLIGLAIIYGNTILLPMFIRNNMPKILLLSIIAFLLYAFVHVFISSNISQSFQIFVRLYSGFLIFTIFCSCNNEEDEKLVEWFLLFIGLYTALYTILQIILYKWNSVYAIQFFGYRAYVGSYSTIRTQGPLLSAGGSSSVMAITIIMLLKKLLDHKFKQYYVIYISIIIAALLVNFTRTSLFPLFVITFVCLLIYKRYKEFIVSMVLTLLLILIYLSIFGSSAFLDRFKDVPGIAESNIKNEQLMQGRGLLVKIIYSDFANKDVPSMIFGNGLNYTNVVLGKYFNVSDQISTHNDFMWLLSNIGIIGLIMYLIFYAVAYYSYQGKSRLIYVLFIITFMLLGGMGGETICITGHRYVQFVFMAYMMVENKIIRQGLFANTLTT